MNKPKVETERLTETYTLTEDIISCLEGVNLKDVNKVLNDILIEESCHPSREDLIPKGDPYLTFEEEVGTADWDYGETYSSLYIAMDYYTETVDQWKGRVEREKVALAGWKEKEEDKRKKAKIKSDKKKGIKAKIDGLQKELKELGGE